MGRRTGRKRAGGWWPGKARGGRLDVPGVPEVPAGFRILPPPG